MATRRKAREWAFQMLFQLDANPVDLDFLFATFRKKMKPERKAREFSESIVRGVQGNLSAIDGLISRNTKHWRLQRMGSVERNVLRMAIYEMLYQHDAPPVVVINEAVDIAKYFGTNESGRFVNGILDTVRREIIGGNDNMQEHPAASRSESQND